MVQNSPEGSQQYTEMQKEKIRKKYNGNGRTRL